MSLSSQNKMSIICISFFVITFMTSHHRNLYRSGLRYSDTHVVNKEGGRSGEGRGRQMTRVTEQFKTAPREPLARTRAQMLITAGHWERMTGERLIPGPSIYAELRTCMTLI